MQNITVLRVFSRPDPNITLWILTWYVAAIGAAFFAL